MKVLFAAYPRIGLNRGGLQIQIERTAEELDHAGVEVILYDPWRNQLGEVDVCHIFSIDGAMLAHAKKAKEMGVPVVLSPVFSCFDTPPLLLQCKVWLSKHIPGFYSGFVGARGLLENASKILPLNDREMSLLQRVFGLTEDRIEVIPNGINQGFASGDPEVFRERYGLENFILQVGTINPNKNQLTTINAARSLGKPLVIVGQASQGNEAYLQQCKEAAGEQVVFTGQLNHDDPLLASAYSSASVFVLPSHSEVMPLCLYEAALAGCRVVVSRTVPVASEISGFVSYAKPDDVKGMAAGISEQMERPKDDRLADVVRKMPTWSDVGKRIKTIYEELLSGGAGGRRASEK